MSEFKITYKTTLYQAQETCKENDNCEECIFHRENEYGCLFGNAYPAEWNIQKFKTYKEDFLEKFPNAVINDCGTLAACRAFIYDGAIQCINRGLGCDKCWNEIMEDENE